MLAFLSVRERFDHWFRPCGNELGEGKLAMGRNRQLHVPAGDIEI